MPKTDDLQQLGAAALEESASRKPPSCSARAWPSGAKRATGEVRPRPYNGILIWAYGA